MRNTIIIFCLLLISAGSAGQQPDKHQVRIADTLTTLERSSRYPVILRSELDSLVKVHAPIVQPVQTVRETIVEKIPGWTWLIIFLSLVVTAGLIYVVYAQHRTSEKNDAALKKLKQHTDRESAEPDDTGRARSTVKKINALTAELDSMKKQNRELSDLIDGYESVKQQITGTFKIRNYPGYHKEKSEEELLKGLMNTEKSVALYAYEHFLKPIIAIADANKNSPARMSGEDNDKLVELLISLALLYTEYLYLRVNELSIGGNMVARIQGLSNGNRLDTILMKQLSKEHGSRALVMRMMLDKLDIRKLSYPVFDETNLNLS